MMLCLSVLACLPPSCMPACRPAAGCLLPRLPQVALAAFDLLFAFDEVISLGHKENVTVSQIKQNTEMESHEEKLHKMIIQVGGRVS